MKWLLILILSHRLLVFGASLEDYLEEFADDLMANRFEECLSLLDWCEEEHWQNRDLINALRATVLLAKGELEESSRLMGKSISALEGNFLPAQCVYLSSTIYMKSLGIFITEKFHTIPVMLPQQLVYVSRSNRRV